MCVINIEKNKTHRYKMPRPQRCRNIKRPPLYNCFKPQGVPKSKLQVVKITIDEYESIRLADYEGLEHAEAAESMGVSRSVFSRLVKEARSKVARAIIDGCQLIIEGGEVNFIDSVYRCKNCNEYVEIPSENDAPDECDNCGESNFEELNKLYGKRGYGKGHGKGHGYGQNSGHNRGRGNGGFKS